MYYFEQARENDEGEIYEKSLKSKKQKGVTGCKENLQASKQANGGLKLTCQGINGSNCPNPSDS